MFFANWILVKHCGMSFYFFFCLDKFKKTLSVFNCYKLPFSGAKEVTCELLKLFRNRSLQSRTCVILLICPGGRRTVLCRTGLVLLFPPPLLHQIVYSIVPTVAFFLELSQCLARGTAWVWSSLSHLLHENNPEHICDLACQKLVLVVIFTHSSCLRPHHVENTSSRPITEVKQHWYLDG